LQRQRSLRSKSKIGDIVSEIYAGSSILDCRNKKPICHLSEILPKIKNAASAAFFIIV